MGFNDHIEDHNFDERRICAECISEPDLTAFIIGSDGDPGCDFCSCDDAPTCNFGSLMDHIRNCIEGEYDWAANGMGWMSSEGGWIGATVWDTYDLLRDVLCIDLPRDHDNSLMEAMIDSVGGFQDWSVANPYGEDPLEVLRVGWTQFKQLVQHHTRFFLDRWQPISGKQPIYLDSYPTPAQLLHAIGDQIARMELYKQLPAKTVFYRVRYCKNKQPLSTPEELGPPSPMQAIVTNRMSPPGIVLFYTALDTDTALAETVNKPGLFAIGEFRSHRPLWLIDFTRLPEVPGFFAPIPDTQMWSHRDARFFRGLVTDFTRPIARDDRVHIEYLPTQVVTEYLRRAFHQDQETGPLDGILYPSARSPNGVAAVLFADRTVVRGIEPMSEGEEDTTWLELINVNHRELEGADIESLAPQKTKNPDNSFDFGDEDEAQ